MSHVWHPHKHRGHTSKLPPSIALGARICICDTTRSYTGRNSFHSYVRHDSIHVNTPHRISKRNHLQAVMSHVTMSHLHAVMSHVTMSRAKHMKQSSPTYQRLNQRVVYTHGRVIAHVRMSHITHMNASHHAYE